MLDRILILLHNTEDARLLGELLTENYAVVKNGTIDDAAFDLCILDGQALNLLQQAILRRRATEKVVLPFLLVTANQQVCLLTSRIWHTIDDVIIAPVNKCELQARVEVLLRGRRLSRELLRETTEHIVDLENLRKNEQLLLQQSRLAAMGEMLSNIGHQWRQPLNNLGLLIQHLPLDYDIGELNRERLRETVKKGMRLIQQMSKTIEDFREFLEPVKEKATFSVNEAVATTVSLMEATLNTVDVQIRESDQLLVQGYRNEFCQALINLITNARDLFVQKHICSPKLVIELRKEKEKSVITVTDNAGGIPDGIMDKIFDPYFTTKGPAGTGMGLFMSLNIIEKRMGGRLSVKNVDSGAEFMIVL